MSNTGYYVYGIIQNISMADLPVGIGGIDGKSEVFTVSNSEIAAMVSPVNLDEFGESPLKKNMESLDWVRAKVFKHEEIIEKFMEKTVIIPMKFCTIFTAKERIAQMLKEKQSYFMMLLEKCSQKHEWGIKIYCGKKEPAIINHPSSGREYLMAKKAEKGKALENERNINISVEQIFKRIRSLASEIRINRPTPIELLHDKDTDQVLNLSLLVQDDNMEKLTVLADDLAKQYVKEGLYIELVGPLPVYSFIGGE